MTPAQRPGVIHKGIRGGQSAAASAVTAFRARVDAVLSKSDAARMYWGILIADADTGETVYELNSDHYFAPASNAKIFTTALALATLGPDYRLRTTLESQGVLGTDGRLRRLVLMGRGDPDISNRRSPYGSGRTEGPAEKCWPKWRIERSRKDCGRSTATSSRTTVISPTIRIPRDGHGRSVFRVWRAGQRDRVQRQHGSVDTAGSAMGEPATVLTEPRRCHDTMSYEIATGPAAAIRICGGPAAGD